MATPAASPGNRLDQSTEMASLLPCTAREGKKQHDSGTFLPECSCGFRTRSDAPRSERTTMTAIEADAQASGKLWREEIRATLALAWPLVLTNLAQTAMTATDVMILGRVGPSTLAASALGANLYFAPLIFGLGLMLATVPMMAREVGRRRNSVRDLRRTVRQGLWVAVLVALPIWALLWNGEHILLAMGQEPALAAEAGHYLRTLQWGLLPFFFYVVLRSFIASLERPGWATVVAFIGVIINLVGNLVLVFGHLGFPEMGIVGSGLATSIANFSMFIGMILVVTPTGSACASFCGSACQSRP
jgi:MATE family multidrug resistance protein